MKKLKTKPKPDKKATLTPGETAFCPLYVKFNDGTAAVRAVRPRLSAASAAVQAVVWLKRPRVQAEIARLRLLLEEKALMGAHEVETHLDALIRFNLRDYVKENGDPKEIHELTRDQAACVKELGIIETALGTSKSLKFFDKVQAIRTKMQRLGLLKDVHEVTTETYAERLKRLRGEKT